MRGIKDQSDRIVWLHADIGQTGAINDDVSWCDFTVDAPPVIPADVRNAVLASGQYIPLAKVSGETIVARTLGEVQADIG